MNMQLGPLPQDPVEKGAQLIRAGKGSVTPFECRPRVEVPPDQYDSLPGTQHCRFDMFEVVRCIDDAGELIGMRDAPARLAGRQQPIVAHAGVFRETGGSAQT
jgi:hypothetical protein